MPAALDGPRNLIFLQTIDIRHVASCALPARIDVPVVVIHVGDVPSLGCRVVALGGCGMRDIERGRVR